MSFEKIMRFMRKVFVALLPILLLLVIVTSSRGNTVQYIYDDLSRIVKVIDDQGNESVYTYDAVGNLLSITKTANADTVAIVDMNPSEGDIGTVVTIYGKGFSSIPSENSVSFNGMPATVSSSNSNTIITVVPVGATTGRVTVQTPTGSATSSKDFLVRKPITITISPSLAFLKPGRSMQFTATVTGISNTSVEWSVNGIEGGSAIIGTIANGLYTSPSSVDQLSMVTISARSIADPSKSAEVSVYLNVERIVSNSVSVVIQPQQQSIMQGLFIAPNVSVAVQQQFVDQGLFVAPGVSVTVQPQQQLTGEGPFVAQNISLYMGPYISSISPATVVQGSNIKMTITGIGFSSVSAIDFYLNGVIDMDITTANIQVNPDGTQMTADIAISQTAATDIILVKITSLGGTSQGYYSDGNIFNITIP